MTKQEAIRYLKAKVEAKKRQEANITEKAIERAIEYAETIAEIKATYAAAY